MQPLHPQLTSNKHILCHFFTKLHLRPVAVPFTQRQTAPFPSREDAVLTTYNALFGYEGTLLTNNDVFFRPVGGRHLSRSCALHVSRLTIHDDALPTREGALKRRHSVSDCALVKLQHPRSDTPILGPSPMTTFLA